MIQFESLTRNSSSFVVDTNSNTEETVSLREEVDLLVRAVNSLPRRCREVMTLRMIYGYSRKEIANELGISENTVKAQLAKGMRKSADYLSRYCDRQQKK